MIQLIAVEGDAKPTVSLPPSPPVLPLKLRGDDGTIITMTLSLGNAIALGEWIIRRAKKREEKGSEKETEAVSFSDNISQTNEGAN